MRCLLIDDDPLFNDETLQQLQDKFRALKQNIEVITSEKTFRERLASSGLLGFDFVILDIMIRWAERGDDDLPDPDRVKGGYFRAGIRCLEAIRALDSGASIPVIIHSAQNEEQIRSKLREQNIGDNRLEVVNKRGDFTKFFDAIRRQVPNLQ